MAPPMPTRRRDEPKPRTGMPFFPNFALRDLLLWLLCRQPAGAARGAAALRTRHSRLRVGARAQGRSACARLPGHQAGVVLPLDVPAAQGVPAAPPGHGGARRPAWRWSTLLLAIWALRAVARPPRGAEPAGPAVHRLRRRRPLLPRLPDAQGLGHRRAARRARRRPDGDAAKPRPSSPVRPRSGCSAAPPSSRSCAPRLPEAPLFLDQRACRSLHGAAARLRRPELSRGRRGAPAAAGRRARRHLEAARAAVAATALRSLVRLGSRRAGGRAPRRTVRRRAARCRRRAGRRLRSELLDAESAGKSRRRRTRAAAVPRPARARPGAVLRGAAAAACSTTPSSSRALLALEHRRRARRAPARRQLRALPHQPRSTSPRRRSSACRDADGPPRTSTCARWSPTSTCAAGSPARAATAASPTDEDMSDEIYDHWPEREERQADRSWIPAFCTDACHSQPGVHAPLQSGAADRSDARSTARAGTARRCSTRGNTSAAQCVSCHGVHGIRRPTSPQSKVYPANIPATCGALPRRSPRRCATSSSTTARRRCRPTSSRSTPERPRPGPAREARHRRPGLQRLPRQPRRDAAGGRPRCRRSAATATSTTASSSTAARTRRRSRSTAGRSARSATATTTSRKTIGRHARHRARQRLQELPRRVRTPECNETAQHFHDQIVRLERERDRGRRGARRRRGAGPRPLRRPLRPRGRRRRPRRGALQDPRLQPRRVRQDGDEGLDHSRGGAQDDPGGHSASTVSARSDCSSRR